MLRCALSKRSTSLVRPFGSNSHNYMAGNDLLRDIISNKLSKDNALQTANNKIKNMRLKSRNVNYKEGTKTIQHGNWNANKKKKIVVNWQTGSERAQDAANNVIKQIFKLNQRGSIKIVNPETHQIDTVNIRNYAKGLDLDRFGFSIVDIEEIDENTRLPLIKIVETKTALKKYSDDIAKKKKQELIGKGLFKKKFLDNSKSESSLKHIKLSWNIKEDDLLNQKANEIEGLLKKGNKINIYIDNKKNVASKYWLESFENLDDSSSENELAYKFSKKEIKQRNFIVEQLQNIVEELSIAPVIVGSVNTRLIMKLSPKPIIKQQNDKHALKDERKRLRKEKLEKRIQRKQERLTSV